jgi:hypothetical protein
VYAVNNDDGYDNDRKNGCECNEDDGCEVESGLFLAVIGRSGFLGILKSEKLLDSVLSLGELLVIGYERALFDGGDRIVSRASLLNKSAVIKGNGLGEAVYQSDSRKGYVISRSRTSENSPPFRMVL